MAEGGKAESHPERFRKSLALGKTQITAEPCGGSVSLIKQNTCDGKGNTNKSKGVSSGLFRE